MFGKKDTKIPKSDLQQLIIISKIKNLKTAKFKMGESGIVAC